MSLSSSSNLRELSKCLLVCAQCGYKPKTSSRRLLNVNISGRKCVKCGARFVETAVQIGETSAGEISISTDSGRDSAVSEGEISISDIGGQSGRKRKRSQSSESESSVFEITESESSEQESYYILCCHCNDTFDGHESYDEHIPCPLTPFRLELQKNENQLDSLENLIQNCGDLIEKLSKFAHEPENSSQSVDIVENVEQKVDQKVENSESVAANSKLQCCKPNSDSKSFLPKVTFGEEAPVLPDARKVPDSDNRIRNSNKIRSKIRSGNGFIYLESQLVDKRHVNQLKHILNLEQEAREMQELIESLIIESNSARFQNIKNSSVSLVSQVVQVPQKEEVVVQDQIVISNENNVPEQEEHVILYDPETTVPIVDSLIDQEFCNRVLSDRTNMQIESEPNSFIVYEFHGQIPLNPGFDNGSVFQNENNPNGDWICPQCFALIREIILRQVDTENTEPIDQDFYADLLQMDENRVPPYCCAFYPNSIFLEAIEFAMYQILVDVNQEN